MNMHLIRLLFLTGNKMERAFFLKFLESPLISQELRKHEKLVKCEIHDKK